MPSKHKTLFAYILFVTICLNTCSFAATAPHAMVVTEQEAATQVGIDILHQGGNAIDAAVAIGYALAVVFPCCGNIGGGGFMTLHLANGKNVFINFREKAPIHAHEDMYVDKNGKINENASVTGYSAVGTPGTVLGLETALSKYGTMTRSEVMQPAIKLAKQGYMVTPYDAKWYQVYANDFRQQPNVAAIFLKNNQPYQAGDNLKQSNLANTLTLIKNKGEKAFYDGSIAKQIVNASKQHGGYLSKPDFTRYHVQISKPIECDYKGYHLITAPPPSSGGVTLCEILNILSHFDLASMPANSPERVRIIAEAMRHAFTDRNNKLGDPIYVHNPIANLLSPSYAAKIAAQIKTQRKAIPGIKTSPLKEVTDTTHYSILDAKGNAAAVTYTLNGFFGARVIAGDTGFFLNNQMDDFAAQAGAANKFGLVQSDANTIRPGKRPLSSMTPTIITRNGKVVMVIGSPGGPRIITSVLLTLLHVIDDGMSIQQAVDAPRYHFQGLPDVIYLEPDALPENTIEQLKQLGYHFKSTHTWSAVEAIYRNPTDGLLHGANDRRRPDGAALGY